MLKISQVVFVFLFTLLVSSNYAKDIKLLEVRNTDNGDRFNLVLEINEEEQAEGLKLYDIKKRFWKRYNLTDLPNGVALRVESGYEVLVLKSQDFENDRGGNFKLNYLVSALSGARKNLPLKFDFDGTSWKVFNRGSQVKKLDFNVKKFFGRNVGIASVRAY
jgi:hypothetical protein